MLWIAQFFLCVLIKKKKMADDDDASTEEKRMKFLVELEDESADIKRLRMECHALVSSDAVNKDAALQVMRLHHAMETLYLDNQYKLSRQIDTLSNELTLMKMSQTNASAIENLTTDGTRSRAMISELQEGIGKLQTAVSDVSRKAADTDARIQALMNAKRRG